MPGHARGPLSSREIEIYAKSALHVYHRGQSYTEYDFKAEDIKLLFPNYRIVFVFPWQSAQKKQNFFAVFTSPDAAADARQQHKAPSWSVEPVDKHKAGRLVDLLQRIEVPKARPNRLPPNGPARNDNSLSPTPPQPSPSPSISNTPASRYYDSQPPGWASTSHAPLKRSAHDAFNSSSDLEHPFKRRSRAASSIDAPLPVSTATHQSDPLSSCPSWALEEMDRLRTELAHLKDKHVTESIEPEMRTLKITPDPERISRESSNQPPVVGPVHQHPTPPNAPTETRSAETREAGVATDSEDLCAEFDAIIHDLRQQLDSEHKIRLSLESELREEKQISETLSKSEAEIRKQLEGAMESIRHGDIYRGQFEALSFEREQLRAKVRTLEASGSASLAKIRSLPTSEDNQLMRGALVAEATRRVNAERARDEARAAKSDLEARIPAVVQLYKELEGIAVRAGV
ncbi:hypothetical protein M407DRAFT_220750, partial [Tulasnella calospora MUT 4182]